MPSLVQEVVVADVADTTTGGTFGSAVTAGNRVILGVGSFENMADVNTPSGFNRDGEAERQTGVGGSVLAFSRQVVGGDGTTYNVTQAGSGQIWLYMAEVTDVGAADKTATATSGGSSVTSLAIGPTGTTVDANEYILALLKTGGADGAGSMAWTNSFTGEGDFNQGGAASRIVSATGTFSTTPSWTTARTAIGLIVTYRDGAAAGTTVNIGQASETDTAGAITAAKAKSTGQASETDTSGTIIPAKSLAIGQASETDTAGAIGPEVEGGTDITIGQATETDAAQPILVAKAVPIGQASETDTAEPVTVAKTVLIGLATETETVGPFTLAKAVLVAQATETDSAFDIAPMAGEPRDLDWVFGTPTTRWSTGALAGRWTTGAPTR